MAKIKKETEHPYEVPYSFAQQLIEDPSHIVSPDGWGKYNPTSKLIKCSERRFYMYGSMDNELDPHFVDISIKLPGFCKSALSKVTKKEPKAMMFIGIKPVPEWILKQQEQEREQKTLDMQWAGKSAVGDVVSEII